MVSWQMCTASRAVHSMAQVVHDNEVKDDGVSRPMLVLEELVVWL